MIDDYGTCDLSGLDWAIDMMRNAHKHRQSPMIIVPKPRIRYDRTWGQYHCFHAAIPSINGYAKTMRDAYLRWYKLWLDVGRPQVTP